MGAENLTFTEGSVSDEYNKQLEFLKEKLGEDSKVYKEWAFFKKSVQGSSMSEINSNQFKALEGMTEKNPQNPLFWAIKGIYTGDMERAIELLLDENTPEPSYISGENEEGYWLVEWLLSYGIVKRQMTGK